MATFDITDLIAFGHKAAVSPGTARPTIADVDSVMGAAFLPAVYAHGQSTTDALGRPTLSPIDFGAVGRTANGDTGLTFTDEHDYIAWAMLLGRLCVEDNLGGALINFPNAVSYSVALDLAGGYSCKGVMEVQNRQRVFGALDFDDPWNTQTIYHDPSWIEGWKNGASFPSGYSSLYQHTAGGTQAQRDATDIDGYILTNIGIDGGADLYAVNDSLNHIWFEGADFTADNSNNTFTSVAHGLENGWALKVSNSGGALPTGLSAGVTYYVIGKTDDTFKLSLTSGGSEVAISDDGTGTHSFDNDGAYKLSTVSQNLRESPAGCGFSDSNQSGRKMSRNITFDNMWIHNCFGSCVLGGSANNHATGRLVLGNTVSGRPFYYNNFATGLDRLDLYGYVRSSHARIRGTTIINTLRCSVVGPFGDGFGGNIWRNNPTDAKAQNFVNFMGKTGTIRVLDAQFDCVDRSGKGFNVPAPFTYENDLYLRGSVIGTGNQSVKVSPGPGVISGGELDQFADDTPASGNVYHDYEVDIDVDTTDCQAPLFEFGESGNSGTNAMCSGIVVIRNTKTTKIDPLTGLPVDSADELNLVPANATENDDLNDGATGFMEFGVKKMTINGVSAVRPGLKQKLTVDYTSDWYSQIIANIDDLYTANDTPLDVSEIVPTEIVLRVNTRNKDAVWLSFGGSQTTQRVLDMQTALHLPVHFRLEYPGTLSFDDVNNGIPFLGNNNSRTKHRRLFHLHDTTGEHWTQRHAFIVADADKAEANTNVENAGAGPNCFNLALSKGGSDYWAACQKIGKRFYDDFLMAVTTGYSYASFTVDAGTNLFTSTAHGLSAGDRLWLDSNYTLPAPLTEDKTYFVIASGLTVDDFKVSETVGGAEVDLTDTGTTSPTPEHMWYELKLADILTVSGTGPSAFRDALATAGYTLA